MATETPQDSRREALAGYSTDQVGEWVAVLESIAEGDAHPYRIVKLCEVVEALRANRYRLLRENAEACSSTAPAWALAAWALAERLALLLNDLQGAADHYESKGSGDPSMVVDPSGLLRYQQRAERLRLLRDALPALLSAPEPREPDAWGVEIDGDDGRELLFLDNDESVFRSSEEAGALASVLFAEINPHVVPLYRTPTPAQVDAAPTQGMRELLERLSEEVEEAIEEGSYRRLPDWACVECRPDSEILVDGWLCARHEALSVLAAAARVREVSDG